MSEIENIKADLIDDAKRKLEALVQKTLADVKGDFTLYGKELAQEFGKWLWKWHTSGGEVAEKNLRHLRAKSLLIAVRRGIVINRETQAAIKEIVNTSAQIALKALLAAVVAL